MPIVNVHNVGAIGINQDTPAHLLPPEAWTDGRNVRFTDNKAVKFLGHSAAFDPPTVAPYWIKGIQAISEFVWVYAGAAKVYMVTSGGHFNITRASGDYSMDNDILWNGDLIGGIPLINNGVDAPQFWADTVSSQLLQDLTNWPASTTCRVLRAYKNHAVALDITKSGTRSPHMVKWSHPADPGSIPVSWDETDPTRDAGEVELEDSQAGFILDALPLRDVLTIYKENSMWGMQHTGTKDIFRFFKLFDSVGAMSAHCVGIYKQGAQHVVFTGEDLIIHDGQRMESVLDRTLRRWLNRTMSNTRYKRSFMMRNSPQDEMWFCFPEFGVDWPSLALVWNWQTGATSIRNLTSASFANSGEILETVAEDWDTDTNAWDSDVTAWDQLQHRPQENRVLQADPVNSKLYFLDNTNQFDGVNMSTYLERTGLAVVGKSRQGEPKVDFQTHKLITALYPKARGGPFDVRVGSQEDIDGPITWSSPITFTPGVDLKIDCAVSGKLMAVRFESATDTQWELDGYDFDIELLGRF